MQIRLNGQQSIVPDEWSDEPLLYLLRDHFALNGPKYGCGVGSCGACTVMIDGVATRSCTLAARDADGAEIVTLEGLADGDRLHPVQEAWIAHSVPQCGYCQNGQIMTAFALLRSEPEVTEAEIETAMNGVLCRCGTQTRIRKAITAARAALRETQQ